MSFTERSRQNALLKLSLDVKILNIPERLKIAIAKDETLSGKVLRRARSGFIVELLETETEAFLPGSQIEIKNKPAPAEEIIGLTMEFKIVGMSGNQPCSLIVSHRALLEIKARGKQREFWRDVRKGQVFRGRIKNIVTYGAFIDLGGVDGLLHVNDFSWCMEKFHDILKIGDEMEVMVLDYDMDHEKVSLGRKQLQPNPWDTVSEKLKAGDRINGIVSSIRDYGLFVETKEGVTGLLHVSEISWKNENHDIAGLFKVEQEIEVMVLAVHPRKRKLVLSQKALEFSI